jgi:hypothetical protein
MIGLVRAAYTPGDALVTLLVFFGSVGSRFC